MGTVGIKIRYVELNPLRAGLVTRVDGCKWSSIRMHLTGKGKYSLSSIKEYLEIEDWKEYLKKKADEEIVKTLRARAKTNRPAGDLLCCDKLSIVSRLK